MTESLRFANVAHACMLRSSPARADSASASSSNECGRTIIQRAGRRSRRPRLRRGLRPCSASIRATVVQRISLQLTSHRRRHVSGEPARSDTRTHRLRCGGRHQHRVLLDSLDSSHAIILLEVGIERIPIGTRAAHSVIGVGVAVRPLALLSPYDYIFECRRSTTGSLACELPRMWVWQSARPG